MRLERGAEFASLGDLLEENRDEILGILAEIEPYETAREEYEKSVRTARTFTEQLAAVAGRRPFGRVAVALPFNNPLYSLVVYAGGAAIGGSDVVVRPSRHSSAATRSLYELVKHQWRMLGVELWDGDGRSFLRWANDQEDVQSLVFTGSYDNIVNVESAFDPLKRLVYAGSGINPLVVGPDTGAGQDVSTVVETMIRSRIFNSGQDCLCTERFYVHNSVWDTYVPALVETARRISVGDFGDPANRITPLVDTIAHSAQEALDRLRHEARSLYLGERRGSLIGPQVFEVPLESPLQYVEKFSPIFTISRYVNDRELSRALRGDHYLGITLLGDVRVEEVALYPHVARAGTVLDEEANNPHAPFGGRGRAGFTRRGPDRRDGPILYSVETTESDDQEP